VKGMAITASLRTTIYLNTPNNSIIIMNTTKTRQTIPQPIPQSVDVKAGVCAKSPVRIVLASQGRRMLIQILFRHMID